MNTVRQLRSRAGPRPALAAVRFVPDGAPGAAEGAFWCAAIGSALSVAAELSSHLDTVSASIAHLPERNPLTRPAVIAYLRSVKLLAGRWRTETRPALMAAADALASAGNSVLQCAQPKTRTARQTGRRDDARSDAAAPGASVSPALLRRMGAAINLLEHISSEFDRGLDQVADAGRDLDTDTMLLAERLQADQVHALLLSQQASTLQSKLDDATMRQHAYWLLGPHAEQIRQEIAMHSSAREGVRRQLDHLRAEQAATQAEACYLQHLLPSLSTYLAGLDRLGAALHAAIGGCSALRATWRALHAGQVAAPADSLQRQLDAAVPHWEALAQTVSRLRQHAELKSIMTPGGYRT